jgi:hypothetical protein
MIIMLQKYEGNGRYTNISFKFLITPYGRPIDSDGKPMAKENFSGLSWGLSFMGTLEDAMYDLDTSYDKKFDDGYIEISSQYPPLSLPIRRRRPISWSFLMFLQDEGRMVTKKKGTMVVEIAIKKQDFDLNRCIQ